MLFLLFVSIYCPILVDKSKTRRFKKHWKKMRNESTTTTKALNVITFQSSMNNRIWMMIWQLFFIHSEEVKKNGESEKTPWGICI